MTAAAKTTAVRSTKSTTAPKATKPSTRPGLLDGVDDKLALRAATLQDKDPSAMHHDMAAWMTALTGVEVTPKQAQIVANLRMDYQRSEANKSRDDYKGLDEVAVAQRSVHMTQAHLDAKADRARIQAEADAAAAAKVAKPRAPRAPRKPRAAKAVAAK